MAIDFFAHDPEEVLEPWWPKVGDRVRIVIGPECNGHREGHGAAREYERSGITGTVLDPEFVPGRVGPRTLHHDYIVLWDHPWSEGYKGGCYAACELEPLD